MGQWQIDPIDAWHLSAPTGNVAAEITLQPLGWAASGTTRSWLLHGLEWSYDDNPASGVVQVLYRDASGVEEEKWREYVTTGGAGFFTWPRPKRLEAGKVAILRLGPGGAGISGTLNAEITAE